MGCVYILGAGVDVPLGLPIANNLLAVLGRFAKGEGRKVDRVLRDKIGRFQFSFEQYAGEQGEGFAERMMSDDGRTLTTLIGSLKKHPDPDSKPVQAMITVLENFTKLRDANSLDQVTIEALAELAEQDPHSADGTLLRVRGIALNYTPRTAFRRVFQGTLETGEGLTKEEMDTLEQVSALTTNFEELLSDLFSGFYTKNISNKKKYVYISWLLLAYFRAAMARARVGGSIRGFYGYLDSISREADIITLNYTCFYPEHLKDRVNYFHGDCSSYIRIDRRELIIGDSGLLAANDPDQVANFISGLDMDVDRDRIYVPSIVPPIAMKPVICAEFLDRWSDASRLIDTADTVVVVGYSFNPVDGHLNDLIAKSRSNPRIIVVNPSLDNACRATCSLLNTPEESLSSIVVGGFQARKSGRLIVVGAGSEMVTTNLMDAAQRAVADTRSSHRSVT